MRLPGFTAERGLPAAAGEYTEVSVLERPDVSGRVVAANYVCSNGTCACSGLIECARCLLDPNACGGKHNYVCSGSTCIFWRLSSLNGVGIGGGGRLPGTLF